MSRCEQGICWRQEPTPVQAVAWFSTSMLEIHSPPDLMTSFVRSVICMYPRGSMVAMSPVENQPSLSTPCSPSCCTHTECEPTSGSVCLGFPRNANQCLQVLSCGPRNPVVAILPMEKHPLMSTPWSPSCCMYGRIVTLSICRTRGANSGIAHDERPIASANSLL